MKASIPSTLLAREEVLIALSVLGEDPGASRVDAVRVLVDAAALPAGERDEIVRAAVDAARQKLDASELEKAQALGFDSVQQATAHSQWLSERAGAHANAVAWQGSPQGIARKQALAAAEGLDPAQVAWVDPELDAAMNKAQPLLVTLSRRERADFEFIATRYQYAAMLGDALEPQEERIAADSEAVEYVYSISHDDAKRIADFARRQDEYLPMMAGSLRREFERVFAAVADPARSVEAGGVADARIDALRKALRGLLGATASLSTRAAVAARDTAYEAYRESLNVAERQRVVTAAIARQASAPEGHFLRGVDLEGSFEVVVRNLGMAFVHTVLDAAPIPAEPVASPKPGVAPVVARLRADSDFNEANARMRRLIEQQSPEVRAALTDAYSGLLNATEGVRDQLQADWRAARAVAAAVQPQDGASLDL